jgi:hypothetical protein
MPLAMSRPWKHPGRGVYWPRTGVPKDLCKLVGKRKEKRSRQTRDPVEASGVMPKPSLKLRRRFFSAWVREKLSGSPEARANWALPWRELMDSSSLCNQTALPHVAVVFGKI